MFSLETKSVKLMGWNHKYLTSFSGILNICEIVICYASLDLLKNTSRPTYAHTSGGFIGTAYETYFYLSSCACLIITVIFLLSFLISTVSHLLFERTILGVMFWSSASILSFLSSVMMLVFLHGPNKVEVFGYSHKLAAGILGMINFGLYLVNAVKSYKACKSSWSYQ